MGRGLGRGLVSGNGGRGIGKMGRGLVRGGGGRGSVRGGDW